MASESSNDTVLVVPGFHGSGEAHWQSWLESQLPESRRVGGIDWEQPRLHDWAAAIGRDIDRCNGRVWLVAHSFGCLASAAAMASRRRRVAGAILVAPADPERFTTAGARRRTGEHARWQPSIEAQLPALPFIDFGLLVASRNDPWMSFGSATAWADRWGLSLFDAGAAGHINVDSGHGPWPLIVELLQAMRAALSPQVQAAPSPRLAYA